MQWGTSRRRAPPSTQPLFGQRKGIIVNATKWQLRESLPWTIFLIILTITASDMIFGHFVLYHSQNRQLRPDDYEIRVVTAADYRSLADPSVTTVRLADGSMIGKGPAWSATNFKPLKDGATYALVTTKGTAHALVYTLPVQIGCLFLGLLGLVVSWPGSGRRILGTPKENPGTPIS